MFFARETGAARVAAVATLAGFWLTLAPWGTAYAAVAAPCAGARSPERIYNANPPDRARARLLALIQARTLEGTCLRDAYVFKARCELDLGMTAAAESSYCEVIRQEPGWRPDPATSTSADLEAFGIALRRCAPLPPPVPPPRKKRSLLLIGGAAVATGIAVALLSGRNGGSTVQDLPNFPGPPH